MVAIDRLIADRASFEDLHSAISAARTKGAGEWWLPGLAQRWAAACVIHRRPLNDCRAAADFLIEQERDPANLASSLLGLCRMHPELARDMLPGVITALPEDAPYDLLLQARGLLAAAWAPSHVVADILLLAAHPSRGRVMLRWQLERDGIDVALALRVRRYLDAFDVLREHFAGDERRLRTLDVALRRGWWPSIDSEDVEEQYLSAAAFVNGQGSGDE
ncbi:hypothetical protein [Haliangium ochraceum]|uniref:hypothetical protein n=1 Tax=Haliangium ochraceum TaxID=80816 RepID=UPI00126A4758|nr:hypothetical protein [Haliangium ochraceum]